MNNQCTNTNEMKNRKGTQSMKYNMTMKKSKSLKATVIALLAVFAAGTFHNTGFAPKDVSAAEYTQDAANTQQDINVITDPTALRAIDGYVANWYNRPVIEVGQRDKPTAAVWCQGGMCQTYSSNPEVVTVDDNGVVTGIAPGNAYIVYVAMGSMTECYQYIVL